MSSKFRIGPLKTAYKGVYFTVKKGMGIFPSGKTKPLERVFAPPWIVVFAFDEKGKMLLLREYKARRKKWVWTFPSGRVLRGSISKNAKRQLEEETGFRARKWKTFQTLDAWESIVWKRTAFLARDLVPSLLPKDEGEHIRVHYVSLEKAHRLAMEGKLANEAVTWFVLHLFQERKKVKKWL